MNNSLSQSTERELALPGQTLAPTEDLCLARVSEGLPTVFVNLLERRYLGNLSPETWDIESLPYDSALPLFREVQALGNPRHKAEWGAAMGHVLTGCHEPGNAILVTLFGDGSRSHLYLGARRLVGGGGRHTEDFLKNQEGAFKAFFNGLTLSEPAHALDRQEMPELSEFLDSARSMAAITGIPSWRKSASDMPFEFQSLDQLVKAVGPERYTLMVVAEPVRAEEIDAAIDICRRLIGFVHAFASITKTQGTSVSTTKPRADTADAPAAVRMGTWGNLGVGAALVLVGALGSPATGFNPIMLFQGISAMLGAFDSMQASGAQQQQQRERVTDNEGMSDSVSASFIDANAEACEKMLRQYLMRLEHSKSNGWWRTAVYIAAENEAGLAKVGGAVRSLCAGDATNLDPIRLIPVPQETLRDAMIHGRLLSLRPHHGKEGHPFGESFDIVGTCVTSEELAILINLPRTEIPGIPMRDLGEFSLSVATPNQPSIRFASLRDSLGRDLSPVHISAKTLNRHVFICGTTGYGKTNTCWQLLLQAYRELNVPFLVIEPAKAEYHRLVQFSELRKELNIYNVGGGNGMPLRLNPFNWVSGIPLLRHINILKAIFSASVFPTGEDSPFPYIVESALYEIYLERGWNLHTSENPDLKSSSELDRSALLPTLDEFARKAEEVLRRRDYDAPTLQRLLGALNVRMHSLVTGTKGLSLNTRRSTPIRNLFARPTVIELSNLGNTEEKAFLMALLFSLLYEDAEVRAKSRPDHLPESLQHITLIEEAHCLLKATGSTGSRRYSDPSAKAVDMFSDMLAEMRAYGEGFIIADQIPTKLAPDILKNTGLKIIHRLTDPAERQLAGNCVNLNEWQMRHLNNLTEGLAVTHFEEATEPVLCYVPLIKTSAPKLSETDLTDLATMQGQKDALHLQRHPGCVKCPAPCQFFDKLNTSSDNYSFQKAAMLASERRSDASSKALSSAGGAGAIGVFDAKEFRDDLTARLGEALLPTFLKLLDNRADEALAHFQMWVKRAGRLVRGFVTDSGALDIGVSYCTAAQSAYHLLGEMARNRGLAVHQSRSAVPSDLIQRDRAAAALGPLFFAWVSGSSTPLIEGIIRDLKASLFHLPPPPFVDNPYCARCEVSCRLLPLTSPYVQAASAYLRQPPAPGTRMGRSNPIKDLVAQAIRCASDLDSEGTMTFNCMQAQAHQLVLFSSEDTSPTSEVNLLEQLAAAIPRKYQVNEQGK